MPSVELELLKRLLEQLLDSRDPEERRRLANLFEEYSGNYEIHGASKDQEEWLMDLNNDCAYFTETKSHLAEDPSLLDYDKFKVRVQETLSRVINNEKYRFT